SLSVLLSHSSSLLFPYTTLFRSEIPFYPSFYPQEITVRVVAPTAASRLLERNALHAYVGPLGSAKPAHTAWVESLRSFVLLTFRSEERRVGRECRSEA